MHVKKYTVILLFNSDGSKILLQKKDRTAFAGKLNGIGGKVNEGEEPVKGAFREMEEETSLLLKDLQRFAWLGTLTIPEQCDTNNSNRFPELWFFGGIVKDENLPHKPDTETEEISWYELNGNVPVTELELAGDGDLLYFINMAKRILFVQE